MIPVLVDGGARVIAPDLIGFGRSDKPMAYDRRHLRPATSGGRGPPSSHVLGLGRFDSLLGEDLGGLIGPRLTAEEAGLSPGRPLSPPHRAAHR